VPDPLPELRAWYAGSRRDLPWRRPGTTAWGVLVSEIMLQQTPVSRVLPVYDEWMARWPSPAALAAAAPGDAVRHWGRLGYPRRALRLHGCAVACVQRHDGDVPASVPDLRALPGVGSYTAAAVAAFAHGRRIPVIDTNVRRVVARWSLGLPGALRIPDAAVDELLPAEARAAVATSAALMELGALVCLSRMPKCAACPITAGCRWIAAGAPTHEALGLPTRKAQAYEGTDRQARGRLLGLLRAAPGRVAPHELEPLWVDPVQRERALAGLVADGLVIEVHGGYALPA
jgi:A/G-specific adenine glycosylase